MCGIVGYVGHRNAAQIILDGLQRLEYRGYDSAGLAVVDGRRLEIRRHPGKIRILEGLVREQPVSGVVGLGHTRWATHGRPSEANAHPHAACSGRLVVVHNGIIEDYLSLKERLIAHGHRFSSETDTEVIAHLIEWEMSAGADVLQATRAALTQVRGAYALAVLDSAQPDRLIATKHGAGAVVIGLGDGEVYLASDIAALLPYTRDVWHHASVVGTFMFERMAGLPAEVDVASEFRYRDLILGPDTLVIAISQSGETADTLGAVKAALACRAPVLGITNVVGSALAREASGAFYTQAGPEIGVASSKTFTATVTACYMIALGMGRARGYLSAVDGWKLIDGLLEMPQIMQQAVERVDEPTRQLAPELAGRTSCLYLGRGIHHPVALEGALKLKEISYIHAEGYAGGEMKHGPIALIDKNLPVVALMPRDGSYDRMIANVEEVRARDGHVIAICHDGDGEVFHRAARVITVPPSTDLLAPLVSVIPLQLLAYHVAVLRGCDVDQPRNLAKSVTVE